MTHLSIPFALLQCTKPQIATIPSFIQSSLCPAPSLSVHGPLLWTTNSHNPMVDEDLGTLSPTSPCPFCLFVEPFSWLKVNNPRSPQFTHCTWLQCFSCPLLGPPHWTETPPPHYSVSYPKQPVSLMNTVPMDSPTFQPMCPRAPCNFDAFIHAKFQKRAKTRWMNHCSSACIS